MFGKKQTVNQAQVDTVIGLLHKAAETGDRGEQDVFIAQATALGPSLDRATVKAFTAASPAAYLAIEARHISSVTGESVPAATRRLDDALRSLGKGAYKVFFWTDPAPIMVQLRKAGDYLILTHGPESHQ